MKLATLLTMIALLLIDSLASAAPATFIATAYCRGTTTAAGTPASEGIVAADPAILPLGTGIRVDGIGRYDGRYRVMDTGAKIQGRHIDLYIADCTEARRFGRRSVHVSIITKRKS